MPNLTLCSNLVEFCGSDYHYLANILYIFCLDKPIKISIDKGEMNALREYDSIAKRNHEIYSWLNMMAKIKGASAFEWIDIPNRKYKSLLTLFLTICSHTEGEKILMAYSKQDYRGKNWQKNGINLLDRDEAKERLKKELGQSEEYKVYVEGDIFQDIKDSIINSRSKLSNA